MSHAGMPVLSVDCDWIQEVVIDAEAVAATGGEADRRAPSSGPLSGDAPAVE